MRMLKVFLFLCFSFTSVIANADCVYGYYFLVRIDNNIEEYSDFDSIYLMIPYEYSSIEDLDTRIIEITTAENGSDISAEVLASKYRQLLKDALIEPMLTSYFGYYEDINLSGKYPISY